MSRPILISTKTAIINHLPRYWMLDCLVLMLLLLLLCPVVLAQDTLNNTYQAHVQYTESAYKIGPGDTLSLNVYNQVDLSQTNILVRDDGYASFNGVGELFVAGKSLNDVQEMLYASLSDLIVNPKITLGLSQARPGSIYLAGAVKKPGLYTVSRSNATQTSSSTDTNATQTNSVGDLRLASILAQAGGVQMNADISHIEVTHEHSGQKQIVDLWSLLKQGDASQDLWLQPGDSIFVPALTHTISNSSDYNTLLRSSLGPSSIPIRIIGDVTTPGVYDLNGSSPYLNSAIAKAGGYKTGAKRDVVAIRRLSSNGNQFEDMVLNPNIEEVQLHPNDIVYVPETKFGKAGRVFETLSRIFTPFTGLMTTALIFRN